MYFLLCETFYYPKYFRTSDMPKHPSMTLIFCQEMPLKLQTTYNAKTCRKINCVKESLDCYGPLPTSDKF